MAQGTKVVVWGASGHALVVADIERLCGEYEIVGFLDDVNQARHGADLSEFLDSARKRITHPALLRLLDDS